MWITAKSRELSRTAGSKSPAWCGVCSWQSRGKSSLQPAPERRNWPEKESNFVIELLFDLNVELSAEQIEAHSQKDQKKLSAVPSSRLTLIFSFQSPKLGKAAPLPKFSDEENDGQPLPKRRIKKRCLSVRLCPSCWQQEPLGQSSADEASRSNRKKASGRLSHQFFAPASSCKISRLERWAAW